MSVVIPLENPLFLYVGNTTINVDYPPFNGFTINGLYAEYRNNNNQIIAESELNVYYFKSGNKRIGSIHLINSQSRSYEIEFTESLDLVTPELVIEIDLTELLGVRKNITFTVILKGNIINRYK